MTTSIAGSVGYCLDTGSSSREAAGVDSWSECCCAGVSTASGVVVETVSAVSAVSVASSSGVAGSDPKSGSVCVVVTDFSGEIANSSCDSIGAA